MVQVSSLESQVENEVGVDRHWTQEVNAQQETILCVQLDLQRKIPDQVTTIKLKENM